MFSYPQSKQKKAETAAATIGGWIHKLTDYFACAYIILTVIVLPYYSEHGYSYIATEKSLFFRRFSVNMGKVLIPLLILHMVFSAVIYFQTKRGVTWKSCLQDLWSLLRRRFSVTDLFAGLYGLALVLSYWCSEYQERAGWGADGWYMGLYTQLILLGIYFLVSKLWKPRKGYFYLMLAASAPVFLLGCLNRFDVYPIEMEMRNPGFISTIGNINWYCGYVVTVFFAGAALLWQGELQRRWQRILLTAYGVLGFCTLVTQGSASGIVALGAVMLTLFVLSAKTGKKMKGFWTVALTLWGACLLADICRTVFPDRMNYPDSMVDLLTTGILPILMTIVSFIFLLWTSAAEKRGNYPEKVMGITARIIMIAVSVTLAAFVIMITVNTLRPGSLGSLSQYGIFTFSGGWGSKRGETWSAGVQCFLEQDFLHKLVGVGPDAMVAYLYSGVSEELMKSMYSAFGSLQLTNVHNEWLTVLLDVGILGAVSFVGMISCAVREFLKRAGKNPLAAACGFSLLAYTVNNFFSFQQIMNVAPMYVILGMGMAFLSAGSSGESASSIMKNKKAYIHGLFKNRRDRIRACDEFRVCK